MNCQFYRTPGPAERRAWHIPDDDDETVLDCGRPQGEGPLWFFVPVEGGAVRVPVCQVHGDLLERTCQSPPPGGYALGVDAGDCVYEMSFATAEDRAAFVLWIHRAAPQLGIRAVRAASLPESGAAAGDSSAGPAV